MLAAPLTGADYGGPETGASKPGEGEKKCVNSQGLASSNFQVEEGKKPRDVDEKRNTA